MHRLCFLLTTAISLSVTTQAAVPVVESYVDSTAQNDTCVVRSPADVANGDIVLLIVVTRENNPDALITPSGFTQIQEDGSNQADVRVGSYYKVSSGSEPSTYRVANTGDDNVPHVIWSIRVSDPHATPLEATGTMTGQISDSITCLAVTTTNDSCLAFYWGGFDGVDGTPHTVGGTGWTETDEKEANISGSGCSASWGTKSMATNGSTGETWIDVSASDGNFGGQFAIRGTYSAAAGVYQGQILMQN